MEKIGFIMAAILIETMVSMAQNRQSTTPEERAKSQTEQIKEVCGLDKAQEKRFMF